MIAGNPKSQSDCVRLTQPNRRDIDSHLTHSQQPVYGAVPRATYNTEFGGLKTSISSCTAGNIAG
jgi:hypothetical protein